MHGGEVIIIAARPAMGKTALGHQIACHIADLGVPAAFFSLEMSAKQLISREIAGSSKLGASSWARELGSGHLQRAAGIVADRPLHLQACPGWTIGKIKARLRRMVSQLGIGFAAIDYLGLIAGTGEYKGNRVQEVGQVSRQIKQLAGELNIPIALLSQLNRGVEARAVKRPGLADLRDSGDIEQDADVALFIHRPEYYLKENTPENLSSVAEILVEKQRNGPTGICELYFNAETIRFGNLKRDHP
jgi:replicative DNA helicase